MTHENRSERSPTGFWFPQASFVIPVTRVLLRVDESTKFFETRTLVLRTQTKEWDGGTRKVILPLPLRTGCLDRFTKTPILPFNQVYTLYTNCDLQTRVQFRGQ